MTKRFFRATFSASFLAAAVISTSLGAGEAITQEELVRRTQELFDAVAVGNQEPWKKYFADDCVFADEKGRQMDKAKLIADISPLPKGFSGIIKVVRPGKQNHRRHRGS